MSKTFRYLHLTAILLLLSMYNVYADSELYHPLERDMLSVQGNGYVVTIIKGLFGTIDYFSFGEDDQFILASEWRYGSGDYLLLDDIYFNAQFSGTSNEEDFSYSFHGFSLWGLFIIGSGEYTHGSNTEPEELTFMGTSSLFFSSLEEQ